MQSIKSRWFWVFAHLIAGMVCAALYGDKSAGTTYLAVVALLKTYGV